MMQRICVVGPCGSGKSWLASRLGERLGLPVVHMDRLYWKPGWVEGTQEELRAKLEEVVAGERWVIDGNYAGTLGMRLARADAVVWLDYGRWVYRRRLLWRQVAGRFRGRPDMAEGCRETFDPEFLRYAWDFEKTGGVALREALAGVPAGVEVLRFRRPGEAAGWLGEGQKFRPAPRA
ncbi:P-loop NTPase family protein [Mucisphaera calidilacus]|nr:topology modulation protein [Mucisphaera calidilacus]